MDPLVTIITPVYNRVDLIKPMIGSVLRQTYKNWELIIVDDNSTDGTFEYLESIKRPNITLVRKSNEFPKGAQSSRNIGLNRAKGEYIIFLDSDDMIKEFCLEQRVAFITKHSELDYAVFPGCRYFMDTKKEELFTAADSKTEDVLGQFLKGSPPWVISNPIWRTKSIQDFQLSWDEKVLRLQDWDWHIQACCKKMKFKNVTNAKPDFLWVFHSDFRVSVQQRSDKVLDAERYLFLKIFKALKKINLVSDQNKDSLTKHLQSIGLRYLDNGKLPKAKNHWKICKETGILDRISYAKGIIYFYLYPTLAKMRNKLMR